MRADFEIELDDFKKEQVEAVCRSAPKGFTSMRRNDHHRLALPGLIFRITHDCNWIGPAIRLHFQKTEAPQLVERRMIRFQVEPVQSAGTTHAWGRSCDGGHACRTFPPICNFPVLTRNCGNISFELSSLWKRQCRLQPGEGGDSRAPWVGAEN